MVSRQFLGHIRRFHVAGEDAEPEIAERTDRGGMAMEEAGGP